MQWPMGEHRVSGRRRIFFLAASVTSVLLAAAAVGFLAPGLFEDGFGFDRARYRPFAVYLIVNALVLGVMAYLIRDRRRDSGSPAFAMLAWLFRLPPIALALLNAILAVQALFTMQVDQFWLLALGVVAALEFWGIDFLEGSEESDAQTGEEGLLSEDNGGEATEIASTEEQPAPNRTLFQYLLLGVIHGALWGTAILAIGLGVFAWTILDEILFEGRTVTVERLLRILPNVVVELLPNIAAIAIGLFALFAVIGLGFWVHQHWLRSRYRNADREFTAAEIAFLEKC